MAATVGCIAGEEIHRQFACGDFVGRPLGRRDTPFGQSGEIFHVTDHGAPFYVLQRYQPGLSKLPPQAIPYRANLYALKDLGVRCVVGWGACGAIRHNLNVGQLLVLHDLLDFTHRRENTFFENSTLGYLRQFPVFCVHLRELLLDVLGDRKLNHRPDGTAAVTEGPRLETPAEARMFGNLGVDVLTHCFAPEVFLARELQLCYAGLAYVVDYAETGSRHRPFAPHDLFGATTSESNGRRLDMTLKSMCDIMARVSEVLADLDEQGRPCECARSMNHNVKKYNLPHDWHEWFGNP